MSTSRRVGIYLITCLVALAFAEQLTPIHFYYSRLTSTTHTEDRSMTLSGDLVSTVEVERPLLRWLPFVKYGETVHLYIDRPADGAKAVLAREAETRTRLFVIGLCSTRQYDRLANEPFEKARLDYRKRRK